MIQETVYYSLEAALVNPEEVTQLDLGCNDLTSLLAEIWRLSNLRKLCLFDTGLTSLPAEIWRLSNLRELDLRW